MESTTCQRSFSRSSPPNPPLPPTAPKPPTPTNMRHKADPDKDSDEEIPDSNSDEAEPDEELFSEITAEAALADQDRAHDMQQPFRDMLPPYNLRRRAAAHPAIPSSSPSSSPSPPPPPTPRLQNVAFFQVAAAAPALKVDRTGLCAVGVVYHEVLMTRGEKCLFKDRKLREYRCFYQSQLRKCWTAVGEGFYEMDDRVGDDKKGEKEYETIDKKDEVIEAIQSGELQETPSEQFKNVEIQMQHVPTSVTRDSDSVQFISDHRDAFGMSFESMSKMEEEAESVKEALQDLHTSNILEPKPLRLTRKNATLVVKSENASHSSNVPTATDEVADTSNLFQDWEENTRLDGLVFLGECDTGSEGADGEADGDVTADRNSYDPYNPYQNQKHPFHHVLTGSPTPPLAPRGSAPEVANYPLWNYYSTFKTRNPDLVPLTPFEERADLIKMDIIPVDRRMTTTELEVMTDPRIGKYNKKGNQPDRPSRAKDAQDYRDRCAATNAPEDYFIPPRLWPYLDPPIVRGPPPTPDQGTSRLTASTQPRDQDQGPTETQSSVRTREHLAPPPNTIPQSNEPLVTHPGSRQGNGLEQQADGTLPLLASQGHLPALSAHIGTNTSVGQQRMGNAKHTGFHDGKPGGKRPRQSGPLSDSDAPRSPSPSRLELPRKDKKTTAPRISTTSRISTLDRFTLGRPDASDHALANLNPGGTKSSGGSSGNRPIKKRQRFAESDSEMEEINGSEAPTGDAKDVEATRKAKDVKKGKAEQTENAKSSGTFHNEASDAGQSSRPLPGISQPRGGTPTVRGSVGTAHYLNPSRRGDVRSTGQFSNGQGASSALSEQPPTRALGQPPRPIQPRPAGVGPSLDGPRRTFTGLPSIQSFHFPLDHVPRNPFHSTNQLNPSRNHVNPAINPHNPSPSLESIARQLGQRVMDVARSASDLDRALANQARDQLIRARSQPNGYQSPYGAPIRPPFGYVLSGQYTHDQARRLIAQLVADPGIDNGALWRVIGVPIGAIPGQVPGNRNLPRAGNALSTPSNVRDPTLRSNQSRGVTEIGQTFGGQGPAGPSSAQNPGPPTVPGRGNGVSATRQTPRGPPSLSQAMYTNVQRNVGVVTAGPQPPAVRGPLSDYYSAALLAEAQSQATRNSTRIGGRITTAGQTFQAQQARSSRQENQPIVQNPAQSIAPNGSRDIRQLGMPSRGDRPSRASAQTSRGNTHADALSISSDSEQEAEGPKTPPNRSDSEKRAEGPKKN
ncbi:hypothetical protein B7494_g7252 [Chlorociboria aeruginascens]|nr:hypothetical protein B7494_g7252 [Chlorociboria aeruginascens]